MPIPISNKAEKITLSGLVKSITDLEQKLINSVENSDKWHKLKEEIEKTDHKIDEIVYKLYGLTEEEIKIVEEQTKK